MNTSTQLNTSTQIIAKSNSNHVAGADDSRHSQPSDVQAHPDLHHELIPLSDGRLGLRRGLQLELQNPTAGAGPSASNGSPPILDFIASNQALDRFGEIILA